MNLLVPAALAFSAIIPIILLLYFMRPKRQERVVGSTLLWRLALQDLQASQPWQRLRITPLLLLQLLAALVIVLILARPAIFTSSPVSGNTIIILQSSASMAATDVSPSRFESARNNVTDLIDNLGPGDYLSLITMARTPQVLISRSQDRAQLQTALRRARVTNQDADLQQALSLASSLAAGQTNAQILVIGDGHVMNTNQTMIVPFPVRYMTIGTDAPNVALMALSSRVLQNKLVAFAQIANFSHQRRSIPVELYADGRLVRVQTATLAAGATGAIQWDQVPGTARYLHAHLVTQDALSADHDAYALVGSSIHGNVLLVTEGNTFLRTALNLQPNIDLYQTTPEKYTTAGNFDLTVFDNYQPQTLPQGNILFVNPPTGSYLFGSSGQQSAVSHINAGSDTIGLLSDVDLSNIHVVHNSHQLKPALWEQTIISSPETPLLIAGEDNNRRIAALGFDLHESDLPLQPAYPILMHNMTNWLLPPPVPDTVQVTPGIPLNVQSWPGADHVTITGPDGQSTLVGPPFPVSPYAKTNSIGIYHVTQRVRGHTLDGAFTVNLFNAVQSHLAPAQSLPILHSTNITSNRNMVPRQLREIWPWVAAFLLLVLCIEWWLFSRNYRAQGTAGQRQRGERKDARTLARGNYLQRSPARTTFLAHLQDRMQSSYLTARKRALKLTKRVRGNLKRPAKGERHVNI